MAELKPLTSLECGPELRHRPFAQWPPERPVRTELYRQLSHTSLSPGAQRTLLGAVEVASGTSSTAAREEDSLITQWLGEAPKDPAKLEFEALQARFASRRDLLQHCIGTIDVVRLLGLRNRQTPWVASRPKRSWRSASRASGDSPSGNLMPMGPTG